MRGGKANRLETAEARCRPPLGRAQRPLGSLSHNCTISCRRPLRGPLNRLAGPRCLARGGLIVEVDPHETDRLSCTAYWGCPAMAVGGSSPDRRWMGSVGCWPMARPTRTSIRG